MLYIPPKLVASNQNKWYFKNGINQFYQFTNPVQHKIDQLLANGVVPASIIVSGIFLSSDQLFGVEKLAVGSSTYLV